MRKSDVEDDEEASGAEAEVLQKLRRLISLPGQVGAQPQGAIKTWGS